MSAADCTPDEDGYCTGGCVTRPHTWSPSGARCTECNVAGTGDMCNDGNCKCECDEEYGPCEEHGDAVVIREGASTRTADDLLLLFCEDAADVLIHETGEDRTTPWGRMILQDAEDDLTANSSSYGCRWFSEENGEQLTDSLATLQSQLESELSTLDVPHFTYWNDGYRIVRVAEDCPLLND